MINLDDLKQFVEEHEADPFEVAGEALHLEKSIQTQNINLAAIDLFKSLARFRGLLETKGIEVDW